MAGYEGYTASAESGAAEITVTVPAPRFVRALEGAEYNLRANALPLDGTAVAPMCDISYQWQKSATGPRRNPNDGWEDIPAATQAAYTPATA